MRKHLVYLIILSLCMMTSCKLSEPPNCLTGVDKCEANRHVPGAGIYQVCRENTGWGNEFNCPRGCSTENNGCRIKENDPLIPTCSEDGEISCQKSGGHTFAFKCQYGYWQPQICASDQCDPETGCVDENLSCKSSESFCVDIPSISALQAICGDGTWSISYCSQGSKCDKDVCADTSIKACGEERINCKEEISNWGLGRCPDGECIVDECRQGYHVYNNECEENNDRNCGGHDISCNGNIDCNTSLGRCGCEFGLNECKGECVNLQTDLNHCGGCNQPCSTTEIIIKTECDNGNCSVLDCATGYHINDNSCEKDDNQNCGSHNSPCTIEHVPGSATVSCDTGQCIATSCDNSHLMDENNHICLSNVSGSCTADVCIDSGNEGVLYLCDMATGKTQPGTPCKSNTGKSFSCNETGTACGTCLNNRYVCSDNNDQLLKCQKGEFKLDTDCSQNTNNDESATSYCGKINGYASCIKECTEGFYKDADGNCTIQCQQGEVWDETNKKCTKPYCLSLNNPKVGDTCIFGRYPQINENEDDKQDLEWQILSIEPGSMLMTTKYIIDTKQFSSYLEDVGYTNVWEKSSIRSWLNGFDKDSNTSMLDFTDNNFIKTAFTDAEKEYIYKVYDNPNPDGETADDVFLFSADEVEDYFTSFEARECYATKYAQSKDILCLSKTCTDDQYCTACWWLRSPGGGKGAAAFINATGNVSRAGFDSILSYGVRPVLWLIH